MNSKILEIYTYPDKILKQRSLEIDHFGGELHDFLDQMYETMMAKNGVGIAAIQVGRAKKALLVNIPDNEGVQHKDDLLEIINPTIIDVSGSVKSNEGCLSVPEYYDEVIRFEEIKVEYFDRFGTKKFLHAKDFLAIAIQHECDHLNGILFVEKLPILKRKKFEKELKKKLKGK